MYLGSFFDRLQMPVVGSGEALQSESGKAAENGSGLQTLEQEPEAAEKLVILPFERILPELSGRRDRMEEEEGLTGYASAKSVLPEEGQPDISEMQAEGRKPLPDILEVQAEGREPQPDISGIQRASDQRGGFRRNVRNGPGDFCAQR